MRSCLAKLSYRQLSTTAVRSSSLAQIPENSASASTFWSETSLLDLKHSNVDHEIFRRHNISFPYRKNQVIVGKLVEVDKDHVAVFTGHPTLTRFAKKELHLTQLVKSIDASLREGPQDFRIGDVLHFLLEELQTPFGEIALRVVKVVDEDRFKFLWEDLQEHFEAKKTIKGRILNPIKNGYAVGIAGLVAFLPFSMCSVLTASKVGVLQPFLIESLDPTRKQLVIGDPVTIAQRDARRSHLQSATSKRRVAGKSQAAAAGRASSRRQAVLPAASSSMQAAAEKQLTRQQLEVILERVRDWHLQEAAKTGIVKRGGLPKPLITARNITQRHGRLGNDQLAELLAGMKSELPASLHREMIEKMRMWGIKTQALQEEASGAA